MHVNEGDYGKGCPTNRHRIPEKRKNTERVDISSIEQRNGCWVIKGTCPIDLEGHPWTEKFEVIVDAKGKIKSTDFSLL